MLFLHLHVYVKCLTFIYDIMTSKKKKNCIKTDSTKKLYETDAIVFDWQFIC
jgi:hypothetical protein